MADKPNDKNNKMNEELQRRKDEKARYQERKRKLFDLEAGNYDKIVVMRATSGYYGIYGHSAVIMFNKIAPELKMRVALKNDTDYGVKFKEGVITLKNLQFYKDEMKRSELLDFEHESPDFLVYRLRRRVSEAEYDILRRSKEIRREKLQSMIVKTYPLPKTNAKLSEALRVAYRLYAKKGDKLAREFMLEKFVDGVRRAHKLMVMVSRGEFDSDLGAKKISELLRAGLCDTYQIAILDLWTIEDCTTVATALIEAKLMLEEELELRKRLDERNKK